MVMAGSPVQPKARDYGAASRLRRVLRYFDRAASASALATDSGSIAARARQPGGSE
jgi:hypothetical protein